jgi:SpoVK/Ycf46/Vps4 family AAA+-type ATPase
MFDCFIPVGDGDKEGGTILEHYLAQLNTGDVDVDRIVEITSGFTPAYIQYLFQQVAHCGARSVSTNW